MPQRTFISKEEKQAPGFRAGRKVGIRQNLPFLFNIVLKALASAVKQEKK